jgi:FtsP/CotA-like multicopper oxidase with cupredoxin domain
MTTARRTNVAQIVWIYTAALIFCHNVAAQEPAEDAAKTASRRLLLDELESVFRRVPKIVAFNAVPRPEDGPGQPLVLPEVRASSNRLLDTSLTVDYAFNRIWNVKQQKAITVHLRSYGGALVGPTLRVRPGDTLRVRMVNQLPPNKPHDGDINEPHGFNTTNLHTHGLHVSPSGNGDNILVMIEPKQQFQNEIYIPEDHPPGTFWYHAHVHGSTAIQVSSGMAGVLIVEGGLDDVPEIKSAKEQVFLSQQMPYVKSPDATYYEIESYDQFGPSAWSGGPNGPGGVETHGWRTTINGQTKADGISAFTERSLRLMPKINIPAGMDQDRQRV